MLITAGVLAATGAVPLWILLPVLVLVDMAGATLGYLWVRTLRRSALRRPAERLERSRVVAVLTDRLRAAGAPGVFLTRLVPGTRVYTNLAAGLIDLRPSTFLLGMLPAAALWVSGITLLGALLLSVVALFPIIFSLLSTLALNLAYPVAEGVEKHTMTIAMGGTSIIIMVGVALETVKQLESQMMLRHYKGFLD
jgi:membrane protein DedA with SNARE-associated domain